MCLSFESRSGCRAALVLLGQKFFLQHAGLSQKLKQQVVIFFNDFRCFGLLGQR